MRSVIKRLISDFHDERLDLEGNNDVIFEAYQELYPNRDPNIFFCSQMVQGVNVSKCENV